MLKYLFGKQCHPVDVTEPTFFVNKYLSKVGHGNFYSQDMIVAAKIRQFWSHSSQDKSEKNNRIWFTPKWKRTWSQVSILFIHLPLDFDPCIGICLSIWVKCKDIIVDVLMRNVGQWPESQWLSCGGEHYPSEASPLSPRPPLSQSRPLEAARSGRAGERRRRCSRSPAAASAGPRLEAGSCHLLGSASHSVNTPPRHARRTLG